MFFYIFENRLSLLVYLKKFQINIPKELPTFIKKIMIPEVLDFETGS